MLAFTLFGSPVPTAESTAYFLLSAVELHAIRFEPPEKHCYIHCRIARALSSNQRRKHDANTERKCMCMSSEYFSHTHNYPRTVTVHVHIARDKILGELVARLVLRRQELRALPLAVLERLLPGKGGVRGVRGLKPPSRIF